MTDNPLAPQRPEPGQHVPDGSEVVADLAARIEGFKDMLLGGLPTGPEAAEGVVPAPPPVAAREEQGAPNEGDPDECQDCAKALGPCPAHQPEERLKWVREKFVEVARAAYNCGLADAGRSDWHGSTDYAALIDSAVRAIAYRAVAREEQGARVPELAGPAPVQPPFVLAGMNIWLASRGLPPLADPWDNPVLCREMRMIGDAMFATMTNEVSAPPAPSPDVAAVVERLLKARSEASGIASGVKGWRMTIPPRPDDSDMLICGAIDDAIAAFAAQARRTEEAERELRRVVQETGGDPETWMGAAEQVRSRMCEHDQMTAERRELRARLMELPEWLDREMRDLADCNQFGKGYSMDALNHACAHLRRNLEREIRALLGGADREGA
jgi:hypothetical protein